jgi:hypothetical protein
MSREDVLSSFFIAKSNMHISCPLKFLNQGADNSVTLSTIEGKFTVCGANEKPYTAIAISRGGSLCMVLMR